MMSLMGLDLGTSSCKGVVFDINGKILAATSRDYSLDILPSGWVEMDANKMWHAVIEICRELSNKTRHDPVVAFGISTQGETVIAVDSKGEPIRPAFMNADNRGTRQIAQLEEALGRQRIYEITGEPPHPMFGVAELMWFKQNEPDLYAKSSKLVSCEDFLMMKLGFEPLCNYSNCCRTLMLDIRKRDWSSDILAAAGLSRDKLGIPVDSGTVAGKLSVNMARTLGLDPGVVVVTAGHDNACGSLGSGVLDSSAVCDSAGSYEGLTTALDQPITTPEALAQSLNTYCHVIKGKYLGLAFFPSGFVPKWYVTEMCDSDRREGDMQNKSVYEVLERKVAKLPKGPTNIYILPHFVGSCTPFNDHRARGNIIGLTPGADRITVYKAVYEGIAYEFSSVLSVLEDAVGRFESIRISGGGGKSVFTLQLRADTTNRQIIQLRTNDAVCQGVAMLAGIGVGIYSDYEDAVAKTVTVQRTIAPDSEMHKLYQKPLRIYNTIYQSLEPVRALFGE